LGLSSEGFVLMGHSLGGYLSGRFLAKFRSSSGVRGLVLLSAAGLAPHPPAEELTDKSSLPNKVQWLHYLWDSDFTPQHAIRAMGE
jgi:pimeloyl-ACP methyl ester carboxylesterase